MKTAPGLLKSAACFAAPGLKVSQLAGSKFHSSWAVAGLFKIAGESAGNRARRAVVFYS